MIGGLIELGLSNLLFSGAIGLLALAVHRRDRYPALAHLLWVLALLKAVTPGVVAVPLAILPGAAEGTDAVLATPSATVPWAAAAAATLASSPSAGNASTGMVAGVPPAWLSVALVATWLVGSGLALGVSVRRIVRFERLLAQSSSAAPPDVERVASLAARELGVRSVPRVVVSAAELSPMTWWVGRRAWIVLPRTLAAEADAAQLRWILAHELAHIRRRDHVVRWLEWVASVVAWWNPVVWWARRNLRRDEEDACDALVLERLQGSRRSYARTLLAVTELMSRSPAGAPAFATGMDAARSLEHRLSRIIRPDRTAAPPRALLLTTVCAGLLLLCAGVSVVAAPNGVDAIDEPAQASWLEGAPVTEPGAAGAVTGATADLYREIRAIVPATADRPVRLGTDAADVIAGSSSGDSIWGLAGDDRLSGASGSDEIHGGRGDDTIRGGSGADTLRGGPGDDNIGGGAGPDDIDGGAGDDVIRGGAGDDVIRGGAGQDHVNAGPGDDLVSVWADGTADHVDCGSGEDRAVVDGTDTVARCEAVIVRDPA